MSNFANKSVSELRTDAAKKWADNHSNNKHWWIVVNTPQGKPRIVEARSRGNHHG